MKHKNYLHYKCKCGFEIEIYTDDLKTGEKDLKKAIKRHKCKEKK